MSHWTEVVTRTFRSKQTKEGEADEGSTAEHDGRLPAGEIGCILEELIHRLGAELGGKGVNLAGCLACHACQLWGVLVELVGCSLDGLANTANYVGARTYLPVQRFL